MYATWLDTIKRQVLNEVALLWAGGSRAIDRRWKRKGEPAVETALDALVKEGKVRARNEEIQRLNDAEFMQGAILEDNLADDAVSGAALKPPAEASERVAEGGIPSSGQAERRIEKIPRLLLCRTRNRHSHLWRNENQTPNQSV